MFISIPVLLVLVWIVWNASKAYNDPKRKKLKAWQDQESEYRRIKREEGDEAAHKWVKFKTEAGTLLQPPED